MKETTFSVTAIAAAIAATQVLAQPNTRAREQLAFDELLGGYSSSLKLMGPTDMNALSAAAKLNDELRQVDPTVLITIKPICPPSPAPAPAGSVTYTQGSQIFLAEDAFKEVVRQKQRELATSDKLSVAEVTALNNKVVPTYMARPQPDVFSTVRGIPCPAPAPAPASGRQTPK